MIQKQRYMSWLSIHMQGDFVHKGLYANYSHGDGNPVRCKCPTMEICKRISPGVRCHPSFQSPPSCGEGVSPSVPSSRLVDLARKAGRGHRERSIATASFQLQCTWKVRPGEASWVEYQSSCSRKQNILGDHSWVPTLLPRRTPQCHASAVHIYMYNALLAVPVFSEHCSHFVHM